MKSGKLFWMYMELLHARKQCRAIDGQACGSSILATNTSFAVGKGAHDLLALLPGKFVSKTFFVIERVDGFFYNPGNLVAILRGHRLRRFVAANFA